MAYLGYAEKSAKFIEGFLALMINVDELFKPYEEFVASTTGYEVIARKIVGEYPLLIIERGGCIKIAMIVIPTYEGKLLTADLSKTEEYNANTFNRAITMVQNEMRKNNLRIPLILAQCRLAYPLESYSKRLILNNWWLF